MSLLVFVCVFFTVVVFFFEWFQINLFYVGKASDIM